MVAQVDILHLGCVRASVYTQFHALILLPCNLQQFLTDQFFGPGWRMYYVVRDGVLIIMLGGGDKSNQSKDIALAQGLSKEMQT